MVVSHSSAPSLGPASVLVCSECCGKGDLESNLGRKGIVGLTSLHRTPSLREAEAMEELCWLPGALGPSV